MAVRNFISLKLFALLIFSMELLAPVVLINQESAGRESTELHVTASHNTWGMIMSLLCEEAGNEEEREGKAVHGDAGEEPHFSIERAEPVAQHAERDGGEEDGL